MNIDRVALACGVRSLFVLMLIMGSEGIVSAARVAEETVEIKANVPAHLALEILQGESIDLFDQNGDTHGSEDVRTVKFKVKGRFNSAKLSFSGSGGLGYDDGGFWKLSRHRDPQGDPQGDPQVESKIEIDMSLRGEGINENVQDQRINENVRDQPIFINKSWIDKELSLVVTPREDTLANPDLEIGNYEGKLTIKVEIPD